MTPRKWASNVFQFLSRTSTTSSGDDNETSTKLRVVDIKISSAMLSTIRNHVENFNGRENAGFIICSLSKFKEGYSLLAREWIPVPEEAIIDGGSALSWSAQFNSAVIEKSIELNGTPILIHSHGSSVPKFSNDDQVNEVVLFSSISKIIESIPTGTVLLGANNTVGSFWLNGMRQLQFRRLTVIGEVVEHLYATDYSNKYVLRKRLDRQSLAIGPGSDKLLAEAKVAIVGLSGGGSHVVQQLAHQGVGTLICVDNKYVDETNLGRLVGATVSDVDKTLKVDVAERVINGIDPSISVIKADKRFPNPEVTEALKQADVVVACLDRFVAREQLNIFCRRYMIPLVDIGIVIKTYNQRLAIAHGQLAVSTPGYPCLRCWLITDAILKWERKHRPPGYDLNPDAPGDAQVVSMNGTLSSEACNCVLDMITRYSNGQRGAKFWQYDGRAGELEPHDIPTANPLCPACSEEAFGDPQPLT